ncbi:unnamed protein product [Urochloa decumbens]|uniref:Uncharacterized protein n=1 Tax=Urochloa decumbens TaxID=240449 RepID=A0ABC9FWE4_9POAL
MPSSAAAAPRSSLEAMLEAIRRRDVPAEDATTPFLAPLPARPRCRGRPPAPRRRRPRPPGLVKLLGNGGGLGAGTVPVDEKAGAATGGATVYADGAAAGIAHPAVELLVDVPKPQNSEPPCVRAEGRREMAGTVPVLEHRGRWWRCF